MEEPEVPFARGKEKASFLKVEALYSTSKGCWLLSKSQALGKGISWDQITAEPDFVVVTFTSLFCV